MELNIRMSGHEEVIKVLRNVSLAGKNLTDPLTDFGERLVRKVGRRLSGNPLKARSARLRNSLTYTASAQRLEVSAGGGDEVAYARIHQYGGTIRPRNKQFLTIPFPGGPADRKVPKRASDFQNTFVAKGIIFQKQRGQQAPIPLFILKRSVTMPARPYMYLDDSDGKYLEKSVADFIAGKMRR